MHLPVPTSFSDIKIRLQSKLTEKAAESLMYSDILFINNYCNQYHDFHKNLYNWWKKNLYVKESEWPEIEFWFSKSTK
jgi:hypothetical protein